MSDVESDTTTDDVIDNDSQTLYESLTDHKNIISDFYTNKKWDKFKKQSNPFELIFTTGHTLPSLSSHAPISRSFFKHWEVLHDFREQLSFLDKPSLKVAFLAEGPGGFIEAFIKYRDGKKDELFGVTLLSTDRCVPNWKITKAMQEEHNVRLLTGKDKTGSLYNPENIQDYIDIIGRGECDYITSDGGFDFSNNFNDQEDISIRLISAEVFTALSCQKTGGSFLLKIYDIHLDETKTIIYILKENYETLCFLKPLTSRPANSEKYILCTNYLGKGKHLDKFNMILDTHDVVPTGAFVKELDAFNNIFVMKQIIHINTSLMSITCNQNYTETLKMQLKKAIKWLHKYDIPALHDSLVFYKKLIKNNNI